MKPLPALRMRLINKKDTITYLDEYTHILLLISLSISKAKKKIHQTLHT